MSRPIRERSHAMTMTLDDLARIEQANNDTIAYRRIFTKMTGDVCSGLLLSQIVYWYVMPSKKTGKRKTRVWKFDKATGEDAPFIAKTRAEWQEETGLTERQVRNALEKLKEHHFIVTQNNRFGRKKEDGWYEAIRMTHLRLTKGFLDAYEKTLRVMYPDVASQLDEDDEK